jgi:hypothetical protein
MTTWFRDGTCPMAGPVTAIPTLRRHPRSSLIHASPGNPDRRAHTAGAAGQARACAPRRAAGEVVTGLLYLHEDSADMHDALDTVAAPLDTLADAELVPGRAALADLNDSLRRARRPAAVRRRRLRAIAIPATEHQRDSRHRLPRRWRGRAVTRASFPPRGSPWPCGRSRRQSPSRSPSARRRSPRCRRPSSARWCPVAGRSP